MTKIKLLKKNQTITRLNMVPAGDYFIWQDRLYCVIEENSRVKKDRPREVLVFNVNGARVEFFEENDARDTKVEIIQNLELSYES